MVKKDYFVVNSKLYVSCLFVVRCAIWYHSQNLKNVKNTHGGVLISVKLQTSACNFTKINTPPWLFFMFSIVQMVPNRATHHICDDFDKVQQIAQLKKWL